MNFVNLTPPKFDCEIFNEITNQKMQMEDLIKDKS